MPLGANQYAMFLQFGLYTLMLISSLVCYYLACLTKTNFYLLCILTALGFYNLVNHIHNRVILVPILAQNHK